MIFLKNHNKAAIATSTTTISYASLMGTAQALSQQFAPTIKKIAIFGENAPEWFAACCAGWYNNAICIPIDFMSTYKEVAYILEDSQPEIMFCSQKTAEIAKKACEQLEKPPRIIDLSTIEFSTPETPAQELDVSPDATGVIIYTSGTTGSPKGVMLTFNNLHANIKAVIEAGIYTPDRAVLVMLPLHHVLPLLGTLMIPLFVGATCAFTPSLVPADIMATLKQHQVGIIIGVPRFYDLITNSLRQKIQEHMLTRTFYSLAKMVNKPTFSRLIFKKVQQAFGGHMHYLVCGGAALDKHTEETLRVLGFVVLEGYGMTEAAPMITFPRPGAVRPGTCGQALSCNEIRLVEGEIQTRGTNIMKGYYNRPDETRAVFQDDWLRTGDLGKIDADGFLSITGRIKDIIILPSGKNINPEEIESKLIPIHPALQDAGVYLQNNVLNAILYIPEPRPPELADRQSIHQQIIAAYNEQVAPYKRIHRFSVINMELPRTRLGKLRRFKLPDMASLDGLHVESAAEPDADVYRQIKKYIMSQVQTPVFADAHLEMDLGLDSLARISLQVFLQESFGVDMHEDDFTKHPTVKELYEYIEQEKTKDQTASVNWHSILATAGDFILPKSGAIHKTAMLLARLITHSLFRFKVTGLENLPHTPFILACNHQSYLDGLFILAALRMEQMRSTFFYAKEKHIKAPWLRFMARHNNVIVVNVNDKLKLSVQKLAYALQQGKNVVVFPEGTRTHDGELGTFRPMFAILSKELNIPIVPASIKGAYKAMPRGRHFPRLRSPVTVSIGPSLQPEQDYQHLSKRAYQTIQSLLSTN